MSQTDHRAHRVLLAITLGCVAFLIAALAWFVFDRSSGPPPTAQQMVQELASQGYTTIPQASIVHTRIFSKAHSLELVAEHPDGSSIPMLERAGFEAAVERMKATPESCLKFTGWVGSSGSFFIRQWDNYTVEDTPAGPVKCY